MAVDTGFYNLYVCNVLLGTVERSAASCLPSLTNMFMSRGSIAFFLNSELLQVAPTVWIGYNESLIDSSTKEVSWQQFCKLKLKNLVNYSAQGGLKRERERERERESTSRRLDQGLVEIYLYMEQEIQR